MLVLLGFSLNRGNTYLHFELLVLLAARKMSATKNYKVRKLTCLRG